ncbi:MAG: hypothetical protein RIS94_1589 [Pseudomonadota bacterium]|jgi:hypothetical protein
MTIERRDFLSGAALLALALGIPVAAVRLSDIADDDMPSPRQRLLARAVSQIVIPRTATPGAGEVGVGDFLILALAHGLDGSREPAASGATPTGESPPLRRDGSLDHLVWLERALDRRSGGDFLGIAPPARAQMLAALDAEAYPPGPPPADPSPWQTIKGLILTGYYTSQTGAAQELRYELVPGRFDNDIPLTPGARAWSSDWTAVEFG